MTAVVARQDSRHSDKGWDGRSQGGELGHWLARLVATYTNLRIAYMVCFGVAVYFFVKDHRARRTTMRYWQRLEPQATRWRWWWQTLRHFCSFARILGDRMLYVQRHDAFQWHSHRNDRMLAAMRHPQGCVLLGAHVGNWELSQRFLDAHRPGTVNVVMLDGEDPRVRAQLARAASGDRPFNIIDLRDPLGAGLSISAALRRGETCAMLGDRTAGKDLNTVRVPFLGGMADFPVGPFVAAATSGALIVPTFCLKIGWNRYLTFADEPWQISFSNRANRRAELEAAVRRWARRLEQVVRRFPHQWHNFYDFWAERTPGKDPAK